MRTHAYIYMRMAAQFKIEESVEVKERYDETLNILNTNSLI